MIELSNHRGHGSLTRCEAPSSAQAPRPASPVSRLRRTPNVKAGGHATKHKWSPLRGWQKLLSSFHPLLDSHDHLQIRRDIGLVSKLGGIPLKSVK